MDVKAAVDAVAWDQALTAYSYPPFTQQWSWGTAQEALGKRVVRVWAKTSHGPILAQWIEQRRGPFSYWFAPQGPVLPVGTAISALSEFIEASRAVLPMGWRVRFERCEPRWRQSGELLSLENPISWPNFRRVKSLNPATNFLVPLQGVPAELFETFHKKTRYNIRLAERHHVVVRGGAEADFPIFLALMQETARRDGFLPHQETYLRTICQTLQASGQGRLRIAEYAGRPLAVNFEVLCGDTVMYLYGASSSEERERMAPYALQWSAIFSALQDGYRWYDFGGGNPSDPHSPDFSPAWEGITRFKERWGTRCIAEAGTWDRPENPLLYRLLVRR